MERDTEKQRSTGKQENRKARSKLRVDGGGVQSLMLCGGALVVTGFVAHFALKRFRKRDGCGGSNNEDQHGRSQGLLSVLQPPLHHNQCCCANKAMSRLGTRKDSSEVEKSLPVINGSEEDELLLTGCSSCKPENMIENAEREDQLMETIGAERENEAEDAENFDIRDNSLREEEEEGAEDEEQCSKEKKSGEESLDGTGRPYLESTVRVIWPTEILDVLSPKTKEARSFRYPEKTIQGAEGRGKADDATDLVNNYKDGEKNPEVTKSSTLEFNSEKQQLETMNKHTTSSTKWKVLVLVLLPMLMLLITCCFR